MRTYATYNVMAPNSS